MKTNIVQIVFLLFAASITQAQSNQPLTVSDSQLVELKIDQSEPVTYTVGTDSFGMGFPTIELHASVNATECMDSFPKLEKLLKTENVDDQKGSRLIQLFGIQESSFSNCQGFSSRPAVIVIQAASGPAKTTLHQLNGKNLSVIEKTQVVDGKWILTDVQIQEENP